MPTKIVDLSARSKIIKNEPFYVHFWECTPSEYLDLLKNPRKVLEEMKINIPEDCRIETTIENHDWIGTATDGFSKANGTIVCNVGTGNIARALYRIVSYGHDHSAIGKYDKALLHSAADEEAS